MKDYRWPGYAIENGGLFATAGCDEEEEGGAQRWVRVHQLHQAAVFHLLEQVEQGRPELPGKPSWGRILGEPSDACARHEMEFALARMEQASARGGDVDESWLLAVARRITALSERTGRAVRLWDVRTSLGGSVEVRLLNACAEADLHTLGEVADMGIRGIGRVKKLGPKSIGELTRLLQAHGVSWAPERQDKFGRWRVAR